MCVFVCVSDVVCEEEEEVDDAGGQWDGKRLVSPSLSLSLSLSLSNTHTHAHTRTLLNACLQTHFWVARTVCYLPQPADSCRKKKN